jgi:hypothetical protein
MLKRESKLEKEIKEHCKKTGWHYWKFTSPANKGVPDRMIFKNGEILFFELKREGKTADKMQDYQIKLMRDAGLKVFVVDNIDYAKSILEGSLL